MIWVVESENFTAKLMSHLMRDFGFRIVCVPDVSCAFPVPGDIVFLRVDDLDLKQIEFDCNVKVFTMSAKTNLHPDLIKPIGKKDLEGAVFGGNNPPAQSQSVSIFWQRCKRAA